MILSRTFAKVAGAGGLGLSMLAAAGCSSPPSDPALQPKPETRHETSVRQVRKRDFMGGLQLQNRSKTGLVDGAMYGTGFKPISAEPWRSRGGTPLGAHSSPFSP